MKVEWRKKDGAHEYPSRSSHSPIIFGSIRYGKQGIARGGGCESPRRIPKIVWTASTYYVDAMAIARDLTARRSWRLKPKVRIKENDRRGRTWCFGDSFATRSSILSRRCKAFRRFYFWYVGRKLGGRCARPPRSVWLDSFARRWLRTEKRTRARYWGTTRRELGKREIRRGEAEAEAEAIVRRRVLGERLVARLGYDRRTNSTIYPPRIGD